MRLLTRLAPLLAIAASACVGPGRPASTTLPQLDGVTIVRVTDLESGAGLGEVHRADSVAALSALYRRLSTGWTEGAAHSPEIRATFYDDSGPVAVLTLASGAFETTVGGRVLRRAASPDEALAFALLTRVPIKHGPNGDVRARPFGVSARD